MPEGPEVRRDADRLSRVLSGQRLCSVEVALAHLEPVASRLEGARVTGVESRGKALLVHFDCGLTLYSHNQLYGRWFVTPAGEMPATNRSLRVALRARAHSALLYSATEIEVLATEALAAHPYLARLGPDVLDTAIDWRAVAGRLRTPAFRRRSLASLYLDQSFLAGVGNYLRSEILFFARVPPRRVPGALSRAQTARLARQTLAVSRRAYRTGGVTNPLSRVARLKRDGLVGEACRFAVFERENLPCYDCGASVARIDASSRRLYFCPICQAG